MLEVKPLLPALVFILSTRWLTMLLELCCLEEEEEGFDLPTLRVQAPLYRRGPGYSMLSGCPTTGFPVDAALVWVPLSSVPLPGHRLLYKAHFPLDRHIRDICPRFASDTFVDKGLARSSCWRSCMPGVTPVSSLCRSCWDRTTFNKASVKGFIAFTRSGLRW
jgi:hypothetical protein